MKERRKYQRFPAELNAKYIADGNNKRKGCKITEISSSGTRIKLYSKERIDIEAPLLLEIDIPRRINPVSATVTLKWIKAVEDKTGFNFVAGGQLTIIEPEDNWNLLDYTYDNWQLLCE